MDGQDSQGDGNLAKGVNSWKCRCNRYVRSEVVADKWMFQSNGRMGGHGYLGLPGTNWLSDGWIHWEYSKIESVKLVQ